jgi:hypothetical protein
MSEIGDTLAIAIEALEEFATRVADPDLAVRIQKFARDLERLQLELDELVN